MANIRTIHYGLGPIGLSILSLMLKRGGFSVAGAIDIDPSKAGRDLGELAGLGKAVGRVALPDASETFKNGAGDIVIHCTGSYLKDVFPQLSQCIRHGLYVISTCEELSYPIGPTNKELAARLDALAKEHKVAILGTGVNPGFVMDTLALALSAACQEVRSLRITRIVDAGQRRLPLQRKVGAGLSLKDFERRVEAGSVRHVGLAESLAMVADSLGFGVDRVEESLKPVIADQEVGTAPLKVRPGQVAGVHQVCKGWKGKEAVITLELKMYVGAKNPRDSIYIDGTPPIDMTIKGGTHGDQATAAIVVNAIPRLLEAKPGLQTMKDLALVHARRQ